MKKHLILALGVSAALYLGVACSSSSDSGSGGSGGESGGSGGNSSGGGGGSASGGSGGKGSGGGGGSSASGGGGGSNGGTSGGDSVALADYPKTLAAAQCAQMMKCCQINDDKCAAKVGAKYLQGKASFQKSIDANRLMYDGKKFAECVGKISGLACTASQSDVDAVRGCSYFSGTVSNGAECLVSEDCKDGGYCGMAAGKTTKECIAKVEIDSACKDSGQCKSGNCVKAMPADVDGKCAAAIAPKAGICGLLPESAS